MIKKKTSLTSPLVSIIIPTYNRAKMLRETLKSILAQTYENIEVIVVSDASKDNTKEVVKSFSDNRIYFYEFENNQGLPAKMRNKGLQKAHGEFIAFCDDDDLWVKKKIEYQIEIFKKHPNILLVCSRVFFLPKRLFIYKKIALFSKILKYRKMLKKNFVYNSSVMMKKTVVQEVGLLDESRYLRAIEDFDYWLRILRYRDKSIYRDRRRLVKYRSHRGGISREYLRNGMTISQQIEIILKKHYPESNKSLIKIRTEKKYYDYRRLTALKFMSKEIGYKNVFLDKNLKIKHRIKFFFTHFLNSVFVKR